VPAVSQADPTDPTSDPTGLEALRELLATAPVERVVHDSRSVAPGSMYACLRGAAFDGHDFAAQAVAAGGVALLVDHRLPAEVVGTTPQVVVDDTRLRLGPIAAAVAGHPSRRLVTVGITGTNGKTTTSHLLATIFESHGWPTGIVGTLHGPRTTPEAPELQATLADFIDRGSRAAVLEVSSHALALHRIDGTTFDAVVFTNLGHDHLDLHGTPEEYFRAKASLFAPSFAPLGVINVDDPHGRLLADAAPRSGVAGDFRVVTYSMDDIRDVEVAADHHRYVWRGTTVEVGIGGRFNVLNSLAAIVTAVEVGVEAGVAAAALRETQAIPGRFEAVRAISGGDGNATVIVDYAHTPDGLVEVIGAARLVAEPGRSVIVVFGCGGDRDREKRPEMGEVAARLADRVIVTSDNPRHEPPGAIIDDILGGVGANYRGRVMTDPDRRSAIGDAIAMARSGDVVVIAGKGHETTQDLGDRVVEFDDRVIARTFMEELS
jgi:UDP-N-acetylmuramoyl-L-alanyl-D-glutamate--2,6-diaminopimelate ligase